MTLIFISHITVLDLSVHQDEVSMTKGKVAERQKQTDQKHNLTLYLEGKIKMEIFSIHLFLSFWMSIQDF